MMRWLKVLSVSATVAFAFLGCNTILENQKGVLLATDEAGVSLEPSRSEPPPAEAAAPDAGDATPSTCPSDQQMCFGTCVSMTDARYGCGDPSCAPCPSAHGTMGCSGRKCLVTACDHGYYDCNAIAADGCEVDLSKPKSCGACNAACAVAAPLCAPAGPSFQCTTGCTPAAPLNCGDNCVDPLTNPDNCGGCNVKCPVVANATATCTAAACSFKCNAPFHVCGTKCVGVGAVDNDPLACGAACTVCPVPANGTATCTSGACGIACTAGYGNCDALAANGCEAVFASDPLNCGVCGKSCAGQACVAGVCNVAPPPP